MSRSDGAQSSIVQVFDWVESEGQNWLVMELVEGKTLYDLIAEGPAAQFQKSLQIQPDPETYSNLGTILFSQGLYSQSAAAFEKALETGSANDYLLWGNLGDAYRWSPGKEVKAKEVYRHTVWLLEEKLAARSHDSTLQTRLILFLAKLDECTDAQARIDAQRSLAAEDAYAWYRIAVSQEICGHRREGLAALGNALQAGFSTDEIQRDPELLKLRQSKEYHELEMQMDQLSHS